MSCTYYTLYCIVQYTCLVAYIIMSSAGTWRRHTAEAGRETHRGGEDPGPEQYGRIRAKDQRPGQPDGRVHQRGTVDTSTGQGGRGRDQGWWEQWRESVYCMWESCACGEVIKSCDEDHS